MNRKTYTIERAYGMTATGLDKQIGWDIMCHEDGYSLANWCNRFARLRDAKAALEAEGITAVVIK